MMVSSPQSLQPPHDLALVIDFVNTLDVETGADALADAGGLRKWLAARDLLDPAAAEPGERERRRAVDLREALRALMLAHNGAPSDERSGSALERAARDGHLGVHFAGDGSAHLDAGGAGFERALARLLIPVVAASADGSWERVKACRADDCMWAFYDRSRNRSGVWCDMAVCGNRTKVRAFRQRAPKRR
ncbi:MAG TPA: CGNR zinc finger domain-containing protein [Solirubrobacteraceae bacterium]|jgi:predicted RNA-binding Zn ribbon-like protein|nr:CGNR zinc finger domain-containing protein [Solirubrobacteraceae bacterium]